MYFPGFLGTLKSSRICLYLPSFSLVKDNFKLERVVLDFNLIDISFKDSIFIGL
jgi:hypothetical protein